MVPSSYFKRKLRPRVSYKKQMVSTEIDRLKNTKLLKTRVRTGKGSFSV